MEVLIKNKDGYILKRYKRYKRYKRNMETSVVDYIVANDKAKENVLMIGKGDKT